MTRHFNGKLRYYEVNLSFKFLFFLMWHPGLPHLPSSGRDNHKWPPHIILRPPKPLRKYMYMFIFLIHHIWITFPLAAMTPSPRRVRRVWMEFRQVRLASHRKSYVLSSHLYFGRPMHIFIENRHFIPIFCMFWFLYWQSRSVDLVLILSRSSSITVL